MLDVARFAPHLTQDAGGIWSAAAPPAAVSYPASGHDTCFELEDGSLWFRHRNECIVAAVKAFPPGADQCIFDVGGGNGFVSRGLMDAGFDVAVVEPGVEGARNAARRGIPTVICATTDEAGFAPASMGAIGLFDVVEHVADDEAFLRAMHRLLQPGGRLYVTVPAYALLWSDEDELAGHHRRYTRSRLERVAVRAGFQVRHATYFFRPLPLPILLLRALPHRLRGSRPPAATRDHKNEHALGGGLLGRAMRLLLQPEVDRIAARSRMAFGASCLLVADAA